MKKIIKNYLTKLSWFVARYFWAAAPSNFKDPRQDDYLFREVCKRATRRTVDFIEREMVDAIHVIDYQDFLKYSLTQKRDGIILEFGVFTGRSINLLSQFCPDDEIFGFDSFEGLPEVWDGHEYHDMNRQGILPAVGDNVRLIKGWFDDTLPEFCQKEFELGLLHIDCDIYSSTKTIFHYLGDFIKPGVVLIFDEFFNYPNFENHEFKAFFEFVNERDLDYKYLAYNGQKVSILIK